MGRAGWRRRDGGGRGGPAWGGGGSLLLLLLPELRLQVLRLLLQRLLVVCSLLLHLCLHVRQLRGLRLHLRLHLREHLRGVGLAGHGGGGGRG